MHLRLLIDGIIRQTTLLIAQLSTTSGVRSPLARLADQVFLSLARELESQGVSRAVAADMFGMALRSYQKKVQRLGESASEPSRTLWQAVYELIQVEQPTRRRVFVRFQGDGEREVAAVLHDLVSSGLVFVTGDGDSAVYGVTSDKLRSAIQESEDIDALANFLWLRVFQGEVRTRAELLASAGARPERVETALQELEQLGRVVENEGRLEATNVVIPLGAATGAETAMLDHFRAVCRVLAAKATRPTRGPESRTSGGSTFTFTVHSDHPYEQRVLWLLEDTRRRVQELWDEVAQHNARHRASEDTAYQVTFYVGQITNREQHDEATRAEGNEHEDASSNETVGQ